MGIIERNILRTILCLIEIKVGEYRYRRKSTLLREMEEDKVTKNEMGRTSLEGRPMNNNIFYTGGTWRQRSSERPRSN